MALFDPNRHYPLVPMAWDADEARRAIAVIASETISQLQSSPLLAGHPLDDQSFGSDLYFGKAGVLWAIDYLQTVGAIDTTFDAAAHLNATLEQNRQRYPKFSPYPEQSSYLFGELPLLLLQYKLTPSEETADQLFQAIHKNDTQPIRELMWGIAGSMLAAYFMHQWTQEPRWQDVFQAQADQLLQEWQPVEGAGYLWTIDLYGSQQQWLGPVHGFASNLTPLLVGQSLLSENAFQDIATKAMTTLVQTAQTEDGMANWPAVYDPETLGQKPMLVQYCHGAPGMVTALAILPLGVNGQFDRMLEQGGELTWQAGPLRKGSNLCHGTGGNGYAFLKLFVRTGDEMWLDRARVFAMEAIEQYRLSQQLYRQLRYPLWTGDLGLAVYLWDCLQAQAKFPTIDVF
ncbi:LanC-like protein [Nodosilinea sp. LEGE 07298]|uniref:lanthionine synthetase C family protein n=1 Tax=Nodosilinea sp. LEGE 07298 TaxID=2777970 RepID=UPI001A0FE3FB|nr:LanC-like protein [Nodosilinea sp. LEGE 07298]MBE9108531.1 LanC-like protein [Nodosilinea sp. LEGE 07298]